VLYEPNEQGVQTPLTATDPAAQEAPHEVAPATVLLAHWEHAVLPTWALNQPTGQVTQTERPVTALKEPALHLVHTLEPVTPANEPAAHEIHAEAPAVAL